MKAWEETWRQSEAHPEDIHGACDETDGLLLFEGASPLGDSEAVEARAKLASAAPEMARLLLSYEWCDDGRCPSCGEYGGKGGVDRHEDDCKWVAVLRKAGVR